LTASGGKITLPDNSDINTFFGNAKIEEGNIVVVDGVEYVVDENNNFTEASSIEI
jgi:hypothetical protein